MGESLGRILLFARTAAPDWQESGEKTPASLVPGQISGMTAGHDAALKSTHPVAQHPQNALESGKRFYANSVEKLIGSL